MSCQCWVLVVNACNSSSAKLVHCSPTVPNACALPNLQSFVPLGRLNAIAAYCTNTAPHLAGRESEECKTCMLQWQKQRHWLLTCETTWFNARRGHSSTSDWIFAYFCTMAKQASCVATNGWSFWFLCSMSTAVRDAVSGFTVK